MEDNNPDLREVKVHTLHGETMERKDVVPSQSSGAQGDTEGLR